MVEIPGANVSDILRCSFCNKTQDDVRQLIAGPVAFICDECVEVCVEVIANSRIEERDAGSAPDEKWSKMAGQLRTDHAACSLCSKRQLPEQLLSISSRGWLCGDCSDAVEDALAQGRPIDRGTP